MYKPFFYMVLASLLMSGCGQMPMDGLMAPAENQMVTQSRCSTYVQFEAGRLSFGKSEVANFLSRYNQYFDSYEFLQVQGGVLSKTYRVYLYGSNGGDLDYVADRLYDWINRPSNGPWGY